MANTVRYANNRSQLSQDCQPDGESVRLNLQSSINIPSFLEFCLGPLIKFAVFDGFFGTVCALLLIFGAKATLSDFQLLLS